MLRIIKSKFDAVQLTQKILVSYRRVFLVFLCICVFFYILPPIFRYIFVRDPDKKDPLIQCMDDRLTPFFLQNFEFDANIRHVPPLPAEHDIIPFVGNGYIGLEIAHNAALNIKYGRAMQLPTQFHPIISVLQTDVIIREATVVEYLTGIVWRFQCFSNGFATYKYYAHRTLPNILMQEIKFTNTRNTIEEIELIRPRVNFQKVTQRTLSLGNYKNFKEFELITTAVAPNVKEPDRIISLAIVKPKIPQNIIQLRKRSSYQLNIPIAIYYSKPYKIEPMNPNNAFVKDVENGAIAAMTNLLGQQQQQQQQQQQKSLQQQQQQPEIQNQHEDVESFNSFVQKFRQSHINVWSDLWATGFSISYSKAENALNGDRINATMYAVLSQTRSYEFERNIGSATISAPTKQNIAKALTYAEGCYDTHHTLQANNLWLPMNTLDKLNTVVSSWMLTLEKQGCHNLIKAGASGVIQAMVLSFGSFRFKNQHLECNMHPKYLHRDFHFRRLNYGNLTHVNVTIMVTNDNKAVIYVALDRSDRSYYACDGGCLDEPTLLTQSRRQFPVKLTEPLTAILYITEDKQHMVELRDALHVKEIGEAPAHEQHVIALHKHGHQLGGLPTLFWVSICTIIIVFHIFLCKLIIKEYCEPTEKLRYRYNKP